MFFNQIFVLICTQNSNGKIGNTLQHGHGNSWDWWIKVWAWICAFLRGKYSHWLCFSCFLFLGGIYFSLVIFFFFLWFQLFRTRKVQWSPKGTCLAAIYHGYIFISKPEGGALEPTIGCYCYNGRVPSNFLYIFCNTPT